MRCALCGKEISDYNPGLDHMEIDKTHSADICSDCVDRFLKWQQGIFAKLFPTKAMKRRAGKR